MIDSATIAYQTPSPASHTHNVRKCPVLSGATDLSGEADASIDRQKTYGQNFSCTDRTLTGQHPAQPPQPETHPNASQSDNVRKCPVLSGPTHLSGEADASTDKHKTYDKTPPQPRPDILGGSPLFQTLATGWPTPPNNDMLQRPYDIAAMRPNAAVHKENAYR